MFKVTFKGSKNTSVMKFKYFFYLFKIIRYKLEISYLKAIMKHMCFEDSLVKPVVQRKDRTSWLEGIQPLSDNRYESG